MADDQTTRSQGEPGVSAVAASAATGRDDAIPTVTSPIAGYIPAGADDAIAAGPLDDSAADESVTEHAGVPGDHLAHELADPAPFEVVDDEAEELIEAPEPDETDLLDEADADADLDDLLDGPDAEDVADDAGESSTSVAADLDDASAEGADDDPIDDPEQLADAETVAVAAVSTRPVKRSRQPAVQPEPEPAPVVGRPVRKTATAVAPARKPTKPSARKSAPQAAAGWTSPARFVKESVAELRKVVWPTGSQVRQYFVVVLAFVLFIIAFVGLLDFGLGWALLKLLG